MAYLTSTLDYQAFPCDPVCPASTSDINAKLQAFPKYIDRIRKITAKMH
jgi:hypothetical protein